MLRRSGGPLLKALRRKGFLIEDFEIKESTSDDGTHDLRITYRPEPTLRFHARITPSDDGALKAPANYSFLVEAAPGVTFQEQRLSVTNPGDLMNSVRAWVERIEEDLKARPLYRAIEEQHAELDALARGYEGLTEEFFSREEADELAGHLDDLMARMTEHIRATTEKQEDADASIRELQEDVRVLKERLAELSKAGWVKTLVARIGKWLRDPTNRELLKTGAEVAQSLLRLGPGGPANPT